MRASSESWSRRRPRCPEAFPGTPLAILLGLWLLLGGCGLHRAPGPATTTEGFLEARFQARIDADGFRGRLRGRLAADAAGRFRIELLDPLGRPVWLLAYDGRWVTALEPGGDEWYRGPAPESWGREGRRPIWCLLTGQDPGVPRELDHPNGTVQLEIRSRRERWNPPPDLFRLAPSGTAPPAPLAHLLEHPVLELLEHLECPRS